MISGIYKILNSANLKSYVGSAIHIENRFKAHKKKLKYRKHPNKHLQAAYSKYGIENFSFIILEYCLTEQLLEREQHWINLLNSADRDFGYNKRTIPNSNLGLKIHTEEYKILLSKRMKGHTYNKGREVLSETRIKISLANKGKKHTKEHIEKRASLRRGRTLSKEQKLKISNTLKGNKCALGHKLPDQQKALMSLRFRKFDKWPHEKGSKCPCDDCLNKRRKLKREYYYSNNRW